MLDIRNLLILPASLGDKMLLVEIKPWFEFLDGKKTGNQLGYKYTISLPAHALDKIDVKVPGEQQIEKPDGYVEVECVRRLARSPRPAKLSSRSAEIEQWHRPD